MSLDHVASLLEKLEQLRRMRRNLAYSQGKVAQWWETAIEFSAITDEQRMHLSAFKADFSELQGHLGAAMRLIALIEEENTQLFTYVLTYMEQLGILSDMDDWLDVRRLRNQAAQDYSSSDQEKRQHFQMLLGQAAYLNQVLSALETFVDKHYLNRKLS